MIGYLLSVVVANIASVYWSPLVVGGLIVPSGTVFAGTSLTARDLVHDWLGARRMAVAIAAGVGLSAVLASPQIAVASVVAFTASEIVDALIYTRLRHRSRLGAVAVSNTGGLMVDSALFVPLAFGSVTAVPGQLVGKAVAADYHRCADMYEERGIDLGALPLVGVGSVCRRQHTVEVERIVRSLAARGYKLHAFGAKVLGLARYADAIASSDSASWSLRGRHVPGCTSTHRSESNCLRFALAWHDALTRQLRTTQPVHAHAVTAHHTSTRPISTGPNTHARSSSRPTRDPADRRPSRRRAEAR
ncbi:hypothetical protein F4560_008667 [Saccharothrix ecbatanensis]|uniref:DeoxyPurine in DNA protein A domain-containing protein n=1 Tax=Saccharothrix ecbatanensis TaxID=1105145 RepID=A0A7W9HVR7_9PSEU|nr:VUT family protein [Saccharothrix ecbatanensis]MBB5808899.1 hypothetical protein [Saccharothrix ecbatanensis]